MNKVIISGNLVRDVEFKQLPAGSSVATISIAVKAGYDKQAQKEKTAFVECVAWNEKATFLQQHFHKGKSILVEGRITQDEWDDKETGKKRVKTKVDVFSIEFFGGDKKPQQQQDYQGGQLQQPVQMTPPQPIQQEQQPIQTPAPNNVYQQQPQQPVQQGYGQQQQPQQQFGEDGLPF